MDLIIRGGKIFFEGEFVEGCVGIEEDRIVAIGKETSLPEAEETLDAKGALVLPGLVDIEVEINLPRLQMPDIKSITRSAVRGGYTSIFLLPLLAMGRFSQKEFLSVMAECGGNLACNVGLVYPAQHAEPTTTRKFFRALALRTYNPMDRTYVDYEAILSHLRILGVDRTMLCYAPDPAEIKSCGEKLALKGMSDLSAFISCRSSSNWRKQLTFCENVANVSRRIVVLRAASLDSYELTSKPRSIKLALPSIYLAYDLNRMNALGSRGLVDPPALTRDQTSELRRITLSGLPDIYCSGHTELDFEGKETAVLPGIPALPISASILITAIIDEGGDFGLLPRLASQSPAKTMELVDRGRIQVGYKADLTIVDHRSEFDVDLLHPDEPIPLSSFFTKKFKGQVLFTISKGHISYDASSRYVSYDQGDLILG